MQTVQPLPRTAPKETPQSVTVTPGFNAFVTLVQLDYSRTSESFVRWESTVHSVTPGITVSEIGLDAAQNIAARVQVPADAAPQVYTIAFTFKLHNGHVTNTTIKSPAAFTARLDCTVGISVGSGKRRHGGLPPRRA